MRLVTPFLRLVPCLARGETRASGSSYGLNFPTSVTFGNVTLSSANGSRRRRLAFLLALGVCQAFFLEPFLRARLFVKLHRDYFSMPLRC